MSMAAIFNQNISDSNSTVARNEHASTSPDPGLPEDNLYNFKKYAYVITCVFGILGNCIIFACFTRTKLKKPSTARYLAAAAVADLGFLTAVLCVHLDVYYQLRVHAVVGPCQLVRFGDHAFSFLSRWYLTAAVIEKYIGVSWPRKKSQICTVFRAKCVIICLAILSIVCYLYITWFFGVTGTPPQCIMYYDKQVIESWIVLTKIDAIVNFTIPYLLIFAFTCLIGYHSWIYRRRSSTAGERFLRRRRIRPEYKEFKTTPVLILLSTCTMILCTPSSVLRLKQFSYFIPSSEFLLLMNLFHYFEVLNSSVKVLIYISGSCAFARQIGSSVCTIRRVFNRHDQEELQTRHITSNMDHDQNEAAILEGKV